MSTYRKPLQKEIGAISVERIDTAGNFMALFTTQYRADSAAVKLNDLGWYVNIPVKINNGMWKLKFSKVPHKNNPKYLTGQSKKELRFIESSVPGIYTAHFRSMTNANNFKYEILAKGYVVKKTWSEHGLIHITFRIPEETKKRRANPSGIGNTLIYQDVERVYARKSQNHICDAACKKADHKYYHDFKPGARMYGLPNGDLLIKG